MAKTNIIFDDKNYSIDESSLSGASAKLKSHLSTVMNGDGATINCGGTTYGVDLTKLSSATNGFISHLEIIAGTGMKAVVGGVEYGVDSDKMSDAIAELHAILGALQPANKPHFGQRYVAVISSTIAYIIFYEDGSMTMDTYQNDDYIGTQSMPSGSCVYEDGFVHVNGQSWTVSSGGLYVDAGYTYIVLEGSQQLVAGLYESGAINEYNNAGHKDVGVAAIQDKLIYSWDELQNAGYLYDIDGRLQDTTTTENISGDLIMPEYITTTREYAFSQCANLTGIKSLGSIAHLGSGTFDRCSNLATIDLIFDNMTDIENYTFAHCTSLTKFEIPASCTHIGHFAFNGCTQLTNLIFEGTMAQWNAINKGNSWNASVPATYVQCSDGQVAF